MKCTISFLKTRLAVLLLLLVHVNLYSQQFDTELQELINSATQKNHKIAITNYSLKKTRLDKKTAYNTFLPTLSLNTSFARLNDDITLDSSLQSLLQGTEKLLIKEAIGLPFNTPLPSNIPTSKIEPLIEKNIFKSSLDLDWVIFSGMEVSFGVKALKHKEAALILSNEIETKKSIKEIVDIYDKLGLVLASEKVVKASEKQLEEQEKYVTAAIKNGFAIPLDLQKVFLVKEKLKIKKLEIDNKKQLLWEKLHQLTGKEIDQLQLLKPTLNSFIISNNNLQSSGNPVEIKALKEVSLASRYQEKMQYSKYIPKIAIKGHYELLEDDLSLLDPKWHIAIGARWNLFDGLKAYNKGQKYKIERAINTEKINEANELLQLAEKNAKLSYQYAIKEIEMHNKSVQLAKNTYKMVSKQYRSGLVNMNDVLASLSDWQKEDFEKQQAIYNQRKAAIDFLYRKDQLINIITK